MRLRDVLTDERGFVHKKLLGIGRGLVRTALPLIPGGSAAVQIAQRIVPQIIGGGTRVRTPPQPRARVFPAPIVLPTPRRTLPRSLTARTTPMSEAGKELGRSLKLDIPEIPEIIQRRLPGLPIGGDGRDLGPCEDPRLRRNEQGFCEFPGSPAGGVGEARMGRYGAALEPGFMAINKRVCLPGMVLGKDFLCYNKGAISNKERLWPKGTAPLLTGGEMAAIRKAHTAKGKVARAAKRLGITATKRRAPVRRHAHAKAATGVVSV